MKWKFWKRNPAFETPPTGSPGPLPSAIFIHLVDQLKLRPDWVASLRCVARAPAGQQHLVAFRIYSPFQASRMAITVTDHAALDGCPHLILFSGTIDTGSGRVDLTPEHGISRDARVTGGLGLKT